MTLKMYRVMSYCIGYPNIDTDAKTSQLTPEGVSSKGDKLVSLHVSRWDASQFFFSVKLLG